MSGALAALVTTPCDVVKTRVMTSALSVLAALATLRPTELLAGAGPRSAWWFVVSSVFFASYERLRCGLQGRLEA